MNIDQYLKDMDEKMAEFDNVPSLGIVGRVKVEFGFHCYIEGNDFWKFYRGFSKPEDTQAAFLSAKEAVGNAGGDAKKVRPGICVTIYADVLSRDMPYAADLREFTPRWQESSHNMILDAIRNSDLPVGEVFYGQVQYKANPYRVAQGEAGKVAKDRDDNPAYPVVRVPVQKFANEQEAKDFVGANSIADNDDTILPNFSELARSNYPDSDSLKSSAEEISVWLAKAHQGIALNNDAENFPLPIPPTPGNLKKYIAAIYQIEASDIDLLQETPF